MVWSTCDVLVAFAILRVYDDSNSNSIDAYVVLEDASDDTYHQIENFLWSEPSNNPPKDHPFSYLKKSKRENKNWRAKEEEKNPILCKHMKNKSETKLKGKKGNAIVKVKLLSLPHQLLRDGGGKKSHIDRWGKVEQVHGLYGWVYKEKKKKNKCIMCFRCARHIHTKTPFDRLI